MLIYSSELDTWISVSNLPESSGGRPIAVTSDERVFVLLNSGFWEYFPLSNSWEKKANFPGIIIKNYRYSFGMNINGNIYLGNCYQNNEFWEYNPSQDLWTRKADFSNVSKTIYGNFAFSSNSKGYVGESGSFSLWEYDPTLNTWIIKSKLPLNAYNNYCCFVINDEIFIGLGSNVDLYDVLNSNYIWRYNLLTNNWIRYQNCPIRNSVYTSFCINGKAYIASNFNILGGNKSCIFEFDPSRN
jgi:hypothetical protein